MFDRIKSYFKREEVKDVDVSDGRIHATITAHDDHPISVFLDFEENFKKEMKRIGLM